MDKFRTRIALIVGIGVVVIVAQIYWNSRPDHNQKVIDSLTTIIKLKENLAVMHELKAAGYEAEAKAYKAKADKLSDSIVLVDKDRTKQIAIYENMLRKPIRFANDKQRDSVISVLYPPARHLNY